MAALETDVIVVGAGPTGLVVANILGLHGVRTLLVERNTGTVSEPRAVSIDDEALRTMQYVDLIDTVRARTVQGYGSYYYTAAGRCFAKVLPETLEYGHPRRSAFRQPVLEAQLREGLARYASVEARFYTQVKAVEDRGGFVRAALRGPDGREMEVHAQYAVACDGGKSGIREALGIPMGGSSYDCPWLIVDLVGSTDRFRHTRVFCDPARPGLALPGPEGTRRYEFMLHPDEDTMDMLEEANVRALLGRHSAQDASLQIARKVVYQFHARIAERWRSGRIFLAGDAAHLSPPFAGQGMNSGVRDAQNLAWKLAWVVGGRLGPALLDTYESERRPHAAALIQMAVRMGRVMMPRSRLRAAATAAAFRALSLSRPARDYVMQMKWKPLPRYERGFVAGEAGGTLRGRLFVQPRLERRDGSLVPLDDLLGKGFAIVELADGALHTTAIREHRPIDATVLRVIPQDHRFVPGIDDGVPVVRDASGAIAAQLAADGLRGVVLRPDRYVAACVGRGADPNEADRLLGLLAAAAPVAA